MLCNHCEKLAFLPNKRICLRCKGNILNNLAVVCDHCSKSENLCAVCLKKLIEYKNKRVKSNCSSCGK